MTTEVQARDNFRALRDYIAEKLTNELGSFATNGYPAIWVEPPSLKEGERVTGVGVIISRFEQNLRQSHVVSARQSTQNFDWEVVIRAYDRSHEGLVPYSTAIAKMRQMFSDARELHLDTTEDVFPQVRYLLNSSRVINLFS